MKISGTLQAGLAKRPHANRSGKIQRPGPDAPGGPRQKAICQQCGEEFWPRIVDVRNGHGKHCSTSCSAKAFGKPKQQRCRNCGGAFWTKNRATVLRCPECRKPKERAQCSSRQRLLDRAEGIRNGSIRLISIAELARLKNANLSTMRHHIDAGNLGGAWDGKMVNLEHPDAARFMQLQHRAKAPNGRGKHMRKCEHCGREFEARITPTKPSYGRFCGPDCSAAARQRRYEIAGEFFTRKELSEILGIPLKILVHRLDRGFSPIEAAVGRKNERPASMS